MGKSLFIAEKPSVARTFAELFKETMQNHDGYVESKSIVVTWCVGHLVGLDEPDAYGEQYKKWRLDTLPLFPTEWKYRVLPSTQKQFNIVCGLLNREDVDKIYVCTDSGREGEYIYRLVRQEAKVHDKQELRVWIDSQTEDEMKRGIREAKDIKEYDNLAASAYLRAQEDWLMGMNFSRLLSLKYGNAMAGFLHERYSVIAVGRVMTCVLGMVVDRERQIREFVKTPFYRVVSEIGTKENGLVAEWKAVKGSRYFESPLLYKENGFSKEEDARKLIDEVVASQAAGEVLPEGSTVPEVSLDENKNLNRSLTGKVLSVQRKTEKKNPPLLYNLAELQNDCSKLFKISPDETLNVIQELYEKKLVTYPRTDAPVLSTAVAKEIDKNIRGLKNVGLVKPIVDHILDKELYKGIEKTKYTDDAKITDHYAVIPTGQGLNAVRNLGPTQVHVYEIIVRRFLSIFLPPAEYTKLTMTVEMGGEQFFASGRYLDKPGYLSAMNYSFTKRDMTKPASENGQKPKDEPEEENTSGDEEESDSATAREILSSLKKGDAISFDRIGIREGETSPPKRFNSGSLILAMKNGGQMIEDEELRAQIKDCGIGTSATRAGILQKLVEKKYLALNSKTQIVTPMLSGEIIYDIVKASISSLLNPELTASWEKGLELVAQGRITSDDYMNKMEDYIRVHIDRVMKYGRSDGLQKVFRKNAVYYEKELNARIVHANKAAAAGQKAAGKKSPAKKSSKKAEE